jgi:hypothetical protein
VAAASESHLKRCPACRREIAVEKSSKFVVRQHVQWRVTPPSTQRTILFALRHEYQSNTSTLPASRRVLVPALSGSIAALLFFSLVTTKVELLYPMTAHTASNDLINLSFKSLALLKAGKLTPNLISSVPESVRQFLQKSNLQFSVEVPPIQNREWCAGSTMEGRGVKQAHVSYKIGNDLLYIFEVSDDDALNGTRVSLPPAAKRDLAQSGWYTDPDHPGCNVVLWKTDEAVCVAVSTMRKG